MGVAFDTLKFVENLEAGGFSQAQAKAVARAFAEATPGRPALKADLREVAFRLETKIEASKAEILKWMFGQTLVIIGVLMALLRLGH